jgi:hypothetical protein
MISHALHLIDLRTVHEQDTKPPRTAGRRASRAGHMTLETRSRIARRAKGMMAMIRKICVAVLLALVTAAGAVVVSGGPASAFAGDAYVNE